VQKLTLLVVVLLAFVPGVAYGNCGNHIAGAATEPPESGSFPLRISSIPSPRERLKWKNHLEFLRLFRVVPEEVTLQIPLAVLSEGQFPERRSFEGAVTSVSKSPAGRVLLLLLGNLSVALADDLGHSNLAGEIFLHFVNRKGLTFFEQDGKKFPQLDSPAHLFQCLGYSVFPTLGEALGISKPRNNALLNALFSGLQGASGLASVCHEPASLVNLHLKSVFSLLGLDFPGFSPDCGTHDSLGITFQWPGSEASHQVLVERALDQAPKPTVLLSVASEPTPGLAALAASKISFDGRTLALYLPLSVNASKRFASDLVLIERLLFPLFIESGAFVAHASATQVLGSTSTPVQSEKSAPFAHPAFLEKSEASRFEVALAHAMAAQLDFHTDRQTNHLYHFMLTVMSRELPVAVTFATFERVARKFKLPIHLIASKSLPIGHFRVFPKVPAFKVQHNQGKSPSRVLIVVVGDEDVQAAAAAAAAAPLGFNETENLSLLENETGVVTAGNPASN
jgi:hypothetical protein